MSGLKRSQTYDLQYPIVRETRPAGSEEFVEEELKPAGHTVVIRRPKAKDMRAFDKFGDDTIAAMIDLLGRVTNLDAQEVEHLDAEDFEHLGNAAVPTGQNGRMTGSPA
jgi:hypothetical protein